MHLVGYLYEDYHDARSLEHKVCLYTLHFRNEEFLGYPRALLSYLEALFLRLHEIK
jgi:hypothetical protein